MTNGSRDFGRSTKPPTWTSSASGTWRMASTSTSTPFRRDHAPTMMTRRLPSVRGGIGVGGKCASEVPYGFRNRRSGPMPYSANDRSTCSDGTTMASAAA
ncbi:MAG: hypothetical protein U1F43_33750 [Myxococcota bacterium]